MSHQDQNEPVPLPIVIEWRNISLPPKYSPCVACHFLWHERKLNKRADITLQKVVVQHIELLKIVDRLTVRRLTIDPHIVMRQSVKLYIPKANLTLHYAQLRLPVRSKSFIRTSCNNYIQWHRGVRARGLRRIYDDLPHRYVLRGNTVDKDCKQYACLQPLHFRTPFLRLSK